MKMGELLQSAGDWQQAKEAYDQATAAAPHEVLCSAPSPRSPRMRLLAACWSFLHWLSALLYFCQREVGSLLVNDTKKITPVSCICSRSKLILLRAAIAFDGALI